MTPPVTSLADGDAILLIAFIVTVINLLSLAVLWRIRSTATSCWILAGLTALPFALLVSRGDRVLPTPLTMAALACLGIGGLLLKSAAVRKLDERETPSAMFLLVIGITVVAVTVYLLTPGARRSVASAIIVLAMHGAWLSLIVDSWRFAHRVGFLNSKLFAIMLSASFLISLLSILPALFLGRDMLLAVGELTPLASVVLSIISAVLNNGFFIGVVMDLFARRSSETQRAMAELRVEHSRLEERARLVDDLHDGFGSQLASARLSAGRGQLDQQAMCRILDECIADLHAVVDTVNNADGDIGNALRYLRHRLGVRLAGQPMRLEWSLQTDDVPRLPPAVILQVLRILQEAINNALKHSAASTIRISAEHDTSARCLRVRVVDDGRGLSRDLREGAGLRSLRTRATRIVAELTFEDAAPGTAVQLSIPLAAG